MIYIYHVIVYKDRAHFLDGDPWFSDTVFGKHNFNRFLSGHLSSGHSVVIADFHCIPISDIFD